MKLDKHKRTFLGLAMLILASMLLKGCGDYSGSGSMHYYYDDPYRYDGRWYHNDVIVVPPPHYRPRPEHPIYRPPPHQRPPRPEHPIYRPPQRPGRPTQLPARPLPRPAPAPRPATRR